MNRLFALLIALACGLSAMPAMAQRALVPVINHEDLPVSTMSGASPTADQVRQAIEAAAMARDWEVREVAPGQLVASLLVRNKHQVSADISYSPVAYSIRYRDSVNMKYKAGDAASGKALGVIHPFYNRWVDDLNHAIRLSIGKLS